MALRYVSNTGSDGASGTLENPWQTLSYAQGASVSGDTINLNSGDIFSPISINKSGIIWDVYGGSNKPAISGFKVLSGWVDQGNGIWNCTDSSLGTTLKKVILDGVSQKVGRLVKFNEVDHGYITITSSTTNSVTNSIIGTSPNLVGGTLVIKSSLYTVDVLKITAQSGNTLTFTGTQTYGAPKNGYGFIVANHINTLTEFGEWSYDSDTKTVSMYFGAQNPNLYTIKATSSTNCVSSGGGISDVQFKNIILEGSNGDGALVDSSAGFVFDNIDVRHIGRNGISASGHVGVSVLNSNIYDVNNNGVWTSVGSSDAIINKNTVYDIALDLALTSGGLGAGYGLHVAWGGTKVTNNVVNNVAGIGIRFEKDYSECNNNHVYDVLKRYSDLGGIYNWNGSTNSDKHTGMKCKGNHVHDIKICNFGTTYSNTNPLSHGIYHDDHSAGDVASPLEIWGNTVWNIEGNGFNLRNIESVHLQDNLAFGCDQSMRIVGDQSDEFIEDLRFNGNVFVARESDKNVLGLYNNYGDMANWVSVIPGTPDPSRWNNNVLARPINTAGTIIITQNLGSTVNRDLAGWKAYLGWDTNSTGAPVSITNVNQFRLETNYSDAISSVSLSDGTYVDMYGTVQPASINLAPYEGILLIKTSETPGTQYTVSTSSTAGGSVSGGGLVNSGESTTLTATADTGYSFTSWKENDLVISTANPYTFVVTENSSILGVFSATPGAPEPTFLYRGKFLF